MNTKQLRLKILDLAIRGKLVPQDPNDEPATALLEKIRTEKERLIKEKKIKRDKNDSSVPSSGMSHYQNMPQNWSFCRLSDIAFFGGGKTPSTENKDFWDKGSHLWVTSKDMKYSVIDDSLVKLSDIGVKDMQVFPPLTILMVVRSGILRRTLPIAILKNEATINQDIKAICLFDNSIVNYIYWVLKASEQTILEIYQKDGTTVESINFERFKDVEIPIPPYSEQSRIVSAIETAFALIDEIEENKTSTEQLIKQTKAKVLDLAVRGKLVPQYSNDEPVSALLERIRKEQKSIKTTTDIFHYPYNIPENWIWRSITDISVSIQYGYTGAAISLGKYKMLRITDIQNNSVEWNSVPFVEIDDNKAENYLLHNNDIVFARTGATVGKSFLIKHLKEKSIFASYLIRIRLKEAIDIQYVKFFFESSYYWEQIGDKSVGTGQPNVNGTLWIFRRY